MPKAYPLVVLAPVAGLFTYCICHVIASRIHRGASPYPSLVGSFFPGGAVTVAATAWGLMRLRPSAADAVGYALINMATFAALGWGYFHFVNLCIASLRIRMLEEIIEAGGFVPASDLQARYDDRRMIDTRIQRLVDGRHLIQRNSRYYSGKKQFLLAARLFDLLRRSIIGASRP